MIYFLTHPLTKAELIRSKTHPPIKARLIRSKSHPPTKAGLIRSKTHPLTRAGLIRSKTHPFTKAGLKGLRFIRQNWTDKVSDSSLKAGYSYGLKLIHFPKID